MIVCVEGSKHFNDYNVFMRAMGVALSSLKKEDGRVEVWSVGPHRINSFTASFCNLSEDYLKGVGVAIRFSKVSPKFVLDNLKKIDYYAYLCLPNEGASALAARADFDDKEVGIFRY